MTWTHVNLRSTTGTRIGLDYEKRQVDQNSNKPASATFADNLWVNVERPDLTPESKVRLVIVNDQTFTGNSNNPGGHSFRQEAHVVDLEPAGNGRFTAPVPDLLIHGDAYVGRTTAFQRVAVVIDGQWQKDPLQPNQVMSDFNVDLFQR